MNTESATNPAIPFVLDAPHRRVALGAEPMVFHCHHYNAFLQRSIQDAHYVESRTLLVGAAAEVAFAQLTRVFAELGLEDPAERSAMASEIYRWAGFGTFDLARLGPRGGTLRTPHSHYAKAWTLKFGKASEGVCHFAAGWLAGALAAIHDEPLGAYSVEHPRCSAHDARHDCTFVVRRGEPNYRVFESVGAGPLTDHAPIQTEPNNVDYEGIFTALTGMEIVGDEQGAIPAFGVHLTRHYANYYNRVSFEFLKDLCVMFEDDGELVARSLFVEAGHVCAFNTFGGIMTSPAWDALIRPSLRTPEDWVHGMCAAVNALGWGRWQVTDVSRDGAEFVLHDDYESVGHLAMQGRASSPVSFLAEGAAIGTMNLVYEGDIASKPVLDEAFYTHLFRGHDHFKAECLESRAMGGAVTRFRVFR